MQFTGTPNEHEFHTLRHPDPPVKCQCGLCNICDVANLGSVFLLFGNGTGAKTLESGWR